MLKEIYTDGTYLDKFPTWHIERSPWCAKQVMRIITQNHLVPKTICEVGCGAGEILKQLQMLMDDKCAFWGYEISPQAVELCKTRENANLHFKLADLGQEEDAFFDLILALDVIEHVEDYFKFLREIKSKSLYKILHIPLDLTVRAVLADTLAKGREEHGHIHYFTKEIALEALKGVGYEVLDYFYTQPAIDLPTMGGIQEIRRRLMTVPRKLLSTIDKDLAARTLGGWSLMVLAK